MKTDETLRLDVTSKTELSRALARIRRERPARAVLTWTHNDRTRATDLPEIAVPEGTILTIIVWSGIPFLHVQSGRVVYRAYSSWGNSITVHGGEVHIVTDGGNRKVTVTVEPTEGKPEPVVTVEPGEYAGGTRLRFSHPSHRGLPFEAQRPKLPEVESALSTFIPLTWTHT